MAEAQLHGLSGDSALFLPDDLRNLFRNKHVVIIGDSIQRCVYKDMITSLQSSDLVSDSALSRKVYDLPFMGDCLVYRTPKTRGHCFCEAREYQSQDGFILVHYYFVTRCYKDDMEIILQTFEKEPPDVILMNSSLWDTSRYEDDISIFRDRMEVLLTRLRRILPKKSMFIWTTALPTSSNIGNAGFLREETKTAGLGGASLRVAILEVNFMIAQMVFAHGFDVLDLHFYVRPFVEYYRKPDGVHYLPPLHRHITHLIAVFLYDSFGIPLPDRTKRILRQCNAGNINCRHLTDEATQETPWQKEYEKKTKSIAQTVHAIQCNYVSPKAFDCEQFIRPSNQRRFRTDNIQIQGHHSLEPANMNFSNQQMFSGYYPSQGFEPNFMPVMGYPTADEFPYSNQYSNNYQHVNHVPVPQNRNMNSYDNYWRKPDYK